MSKSIREEYLFFWWCHRLYKRWREPHIMSAMNIIFNAWFETASGRRLHNGQSMFTCAQESLRMRDYPSIESFYIPLEIHEVK